MTSRASNRFALLAAERLAPFQLQLAAQQGQREATTQGSVLSALDKLIAAAGDVPGMVNKGLAAAGDVDAAERLARLQGRAGVLGPEQATTVEGPPALVSPPPVDVPGTPPKIDAKAALDLDTPGAYPTPPPPEKVQPRGVEVPPTPPPPSPRAYVNPTAYDEAKAALAEGAPDKSTHTGNWWNDLVANPIANEIAKRGRERVILPASQEVAQERQRVDTNAIKAKQDALEQFWKAMNYKREVGHDTALESQNQATLDSLNAYRGAEIKGKQAEIASHENVAAATREATKESKDADRNLALTLKKMDLDGKHAEAEERKRVSQARLAPAIGKSYTSTTAGIRAADKALALLQDKNLQTWTGLAAGRLTGSEFLSDLIASAPGLDASKLPLLDQSLQAIAIESKNAAQGAPVKAFDYHALSSFDLSRKRPVGVLVKSVADARANLLAHKAELERLYPSVLRGEAPDGEGAPLFATDPTDAGVPDAGAPDAAGGGSFLGRFKR